jgi:molecular chaperone GrpE
VATLQQPDQYKATTVRDFSEKTSESKDQESVESPTEVPVADELKTAQDRYLRLAADFENYKKRAQKDQEDYIKYANERILKDLLTVLDNLQRALQHAQQFDSANGLVQGIELTCKNYVETLSRHGVKEISSMGLPFDPAVHQAVALIEAKEGQAPNTVVAEHEKGYYLYDRVLRPAMVTVAGSNKAAGD